MLEQTKKNGRVYDIRPGEKSVLSKPAIIPELEFGPYRPVSIYRINDHDMWVKDEAHGGWYHYTGETYPLKLVETQDSHEEKGISCFYLYGVAEYKNGSQYEGEQIPYFVQDVPYVKKRIIPDIQSMEMPFSMLALDYDRIFTYPDSLKKLLEDCPVAYADRFKRPIIRSNGHTYPISLSKQAFKWETLPDSRYPVVADLADTHFAVLDLEPSRTRDEETVYESIMGYYEEKTIRGGRHKLVRLDDTTFKFRYGKGLELIANGMITFYGIEGKMLHASPEPMKTTGFAPVGHVARMMKPADMPVEITRLAEKLESYTGDLFLIKTRIRDKHASNTDNSDREFRILLDLYKQVVNPYRNMFTEEQIPWVLTACAADIIEPREKHATQRNGLPYLVYLSAIICEKKEGAKIWKPT